MEGKALSRIIRRTGKGWELEADPRRAELVVGQLGLGDANGGVTQMPALTSKLYKGDNIRVLFSPIGQDTHTLTT